MSRTQRIKQQAKKHARTAKEYAQNHSRPTMCLHCHLIVSMLKNEAGQRWECERCGHLYYFRDWDIKCKTV